MNKYDIGEKVINLLNNDIYHILATKQIKGFKGRMQVRVPPDYDYVVIEEDDNNDGMMMPIQEKFLIPTGSKINHLSPLKKR
jgi:hypothetical protein